MIKTIAFDPHNFNPLPNQLCQAGTAVPLDDIDVDIDQLCHQLFLDCHGAVPTVNPAVAYLLALLTNSSAFEFAGAGPGTHKEIRIAESNKYGKAFCRWFLYTHVGMTYFAHMDKVLNGGLPAPYNTWSVKKTVKGDAPDYVCANNTSTISLGEAKGRQAAVTWAAAAEPFVTWRNQFTRLDIKNPGGTSVKLKGYIVAAVMRNQSHKKLQSELIVEDPETPGDRLMNNEEGGALRPAIMAHHYSDVLDRIAQPVHAAYLRSGLLFPDEINRQAFVWNCLVPALRGRQFVGGYLPPPGLPSYDSYLLPFVDEGRWRAIGQINLNHPRFTFFGLDKAVFEGVLGAIRKGVGNLAAVEQQVVPTMPEAVSFCRDGTLICSVDYMLLDGAIDL
jgi:hypothetical protein